MDIRFYTGDGSLVLICADYVRVEWQECLKTEGKSTITVLKSHPLSDVITQNPVLIVKYGESQGIVCGYRFEGDYLFVTVKSLLTLLTRRIIAGHFGEEELTFSGNPLNVIRDKILPFASYITFKGEAEQSITAKTVTADCGTTLLDVCRQLLEGTEIGMKIEFEPQSAGYFFSFIYPKEYLLRLSEGNKNLSSVSASRDITAIENSGYFLLPFEPAVDWDPIRDTSLIADNDPENYLKQYRITLTATLMGYTLYEGQYLYCDTQDGKLKISDTEKAFSTRYISLEADPVLVFEGDFRKYSEQEAMSLLEIRKYVSEHWTASPILEKSFSVGTVVTVEKEVGTEKGLKKLQVISVKTDTAEPLPCIELA